MESDLRKLRAWWARKQGLLEVDPSRSPSDVLETFGWARSVAGCNTYLTGFSRSGIGREQADQAVANLDISELPSARSCTYVLPSEDFALGLALSRMSGGSEIKLAKALGSSEEELQLLGEGVLRALDTKELDPAGLKTELGDLIRNYGDVGKAKGLTTSLPAVLGKLQREGLIVRRPVSGRLDDQRYRYVAWKSEAQRTDLSEDQALQMLALKFFQWIGPAKLSQFCEFAGITQRAAKLAIAELDLSDFESSGRFILNDEIEAFRKFERPDDPVFRVLNRLDSLLLLQESLDSLIDPSNLAALQRITGSNGPVKELGFNPITDRGEIVGLWEFDPECGKIDFASFSPPTDEMLSEISRSEVFIRDQLGDARTFSLDSPKSRQIKIDQLRKGNFLTTV